MDFKARRKLAVAVSAIVTTVLAAAPAPVCAMAVYDAAAVRQLVAQVGYWQEQLSAMANELGQLQQTHAALTGDRGMQSLLPTSAAARNYLPATWGELLEVMASASTTFPDLSAAVAAAIEARAVLDEARLAVMTAEERASLERARRSAAVAAATAQQAYANAGQRFAVLEELVTAIGTAGDAKAIADLQARIAAEQVMLGNEQAKLATLFQAAQAEQWAQAAELRERAIAGHGQFGARLRPELP